MVCTYKGKSAGYHYRIAEIGYADAEEDRFFRIVDRMSEFGWEIDTGVFGWGGCKVADKEEFNEFMIDWKQAKREIKR